jgi:hypothetical protein
MHWSAYRHVLGVALSLGELFDLQLAPDVWPLDSDEQAQGCGISNSHALQITTAP